MKTIVLADAEAAAREAARNMAEEIRAGVAARGRFIIAFSGGHTPAPMLRALAGEKVPWPAVHVAQVDERVAPAGDKDRNLTGLREALLDHVPLAEGQIHAMPVEEANLEAACGTYSRILEQIAGRPPVLDLVHLGLGPDGHTASLVPDDPVLSVTDQDVALTGLYQHRRRMTLTYPILNRSRLLLWLVIGADKAEMLRGLLAADPAIPAGRIRHDQAFVFADRSAAGQTGTAVP